MANKNGFFSWLDKFKPLKLDPINPQGVNPPTLTSQGLDQEKQNLFQHKNLYGYYSNYANGSFNKNQAELHNLVQKFFNYLNSRKDLLKTLDGLRNNDVVQTIIDVMIDDGFYATSNPQIFTVEYKGKVNKDMFQSVIDDFIKKHNLNDIIIDILEDLLLFGEYLLRLEMKDKEGIVKIIDDVNIENIFGIYNGTNREFFLKRTEKGVTKLPPESYAHFVLSPRKLRVQFEGLGDYIPSHIRVGRPAILNAINKLKQLQLLEMGNLALDLKQILAPILVMIGLPAVTQPSEAGAIIEEYEKHLSDMFENVDIEKNMDFSQMLAMASKIKVLPNYSDGKGSIETLQVTTDKTADREREESVRRSIASATGVPFYYLSILGETGSTKLESLKVYSRYSRKLNGIQYSVAKGIKEIFNFHFKALGHNIDPEDISVKMRTIVNVDMLDNMEYLVTIATAIGDFFDNITRITESEEVNVKLNTEKFIQMLQALLDQIPNAEGLIEYQKPETPEGGGGEFI